MIQLVHYLPYGGGAISNVERNMDKNMLKERKKPNNNNKNRLPIKAANRRRKKVINVGFLNCL